MPIKTLFCLLYLLKKWVGIGVGREIALVFVMAGEIGLTVTLAVIKIKFIQVAGEKISTTTPFQSYPLQLSQVIKEKYQI